MPLALINILLPQHFAGILQHSAPHPPEAAFITPHSSHSPCDESQASIEGTPPPPTAAQNTPNILVLSEELVFYISHHCCSASASQTLNLFSDLSVRREQTSGPDLSRWWNAFWIPMFLSYFLSRLREDVWHQMSRLRLQDWCRRPLPGGPGLQLARHVLCLRRKSFWWIRFLAGPSSARVCGSAVMPEHPPASFSEPLKLHFSSFFFSFGRLLSTCSSSSSLLWSKPESETRRVNTALTAQALLRKKKKCANSRWHWWSLIRFSICLCVSVSFHL